MTPSDALAGVKRLFLDSAPVIYFVEGHPGYQTRVDPFFQAVANGQIEAVTSPVTLAECLVTPAKAADLALQRSFRDLILGGTGVHFQFIEERIARRAVRFRALYNLELLDAFQVGAALAAGCDALLTNDLKLRRVTELRIVLLDELEP